LKDCFNNRWCCGEDAKKEPGCCADESRVFELAETVGTANETNTNTRTSSTWASPSSPITGTPNPTASTTSSPGNTQLSSQSLTVAVAVPLSVVALVALAVAVAWFARRHQKKDKGTTGNLADQDETRDSVVTKQQHFTPTYHHPSSTLEMWTETPSTEPAELLGAKTGQPGHPTTVLGELGETEYRELPGSPPSHHRRHYGLVQP